MTRRASQNEIARRLGIAPSSVNRWQTGDPKPESVRAFAIEYGRPVPEAFVAAGFMQPEDVEEAPTPGPVPPASLSVEEAVERIWGLTALPEETRRALILDLMEREARGESEAS
ncbi:helix-turn-helix domain-containing protein [Actinopolymorpha pittospori]|uniref:Transcriptional regulator with XRE-family HTH domain n=1 Tax=Actinopolymorpha pittospori TaxID=648752 RepID=A0A927MU42_9ACTN|nr:helix-turn-helix domain-containing protein [Actinopolymorpha pittospori]MBE1606224.1 transcriptional regulator with XRE-family HTH domain [Actinopolymorpha pittospori]